MRPRRQHGRSGDFSHTITVERHPWNDPDEIVEVEVDISGKYNFTPGEPQTWEDPGCPPEIDLYDVIDESGEKIKLTESQEEEVREVILELMDGEPYDDD